jgi:opacity protein-like surface antigen
MRSVKFLIAAGAASLLSSVAFAADMPSIMPPPPVSYAPPPIEDFGGWYLRGDIGFSNQRVDNIRKNDPLAYSQISSLRETNTFDSGGIFDVGVGYRFNNWFRTDVTAQYRGNANFKGTDVFNASAFGVAYNGQDNYSASKSELLFLANAYVDLGTWWCITPFVGAGVGTSRVTISGFSDNGVNNLQQPGAPALPFAGGPPVASAATAASGSQWNFAWALHAGLAYQISPNVTLELAYSYVDLGTGTTGVISDFTGFQAGHVFKFNNITSNDVKLGVRWNFDTPAVYAPPPPPLIRKG